MPPVNQSDLGFDAGTTWEQVKMGFTPDWLKKSCGNFSANHTVKYKAKPKQLLDYEIQM